MDGTHDLGGRQGFGSVTVEGNRASFHEDWEKRINAINGALVGKRVYNMDEYRHAIERMEPRHYYAASYYERVFTAVVTLCVEKGVFDAQALAAQAQERIPLALPSAAGRAAERQVAEYKVGDKVRVGQQFVAGHVRMPAYVRGQVGTVVRVSPPYPFPDAAAHGIATEKQPTCDVLFNAADLWPGAEPGEVCVGLFVSYLEPA